MASRRLVIAANWKMYKTSAQAAEFAAGLRREIATPIAVAWVVCPPATAIEATRKGLEGSGVGVGGQNCWHEAEGAFTGEVSAGQLKEAGCTHVIIGHSERRKLFGDTDAIINRKLKAVLREGLTPIFCVGETLQEREAGRTQQVVRTQLVDGLDGVKPQDLNKFIIAYEPVWAIGTGKNATPEQAQEVHAFIRGYLRNAAPGTDGVVPILYGGSVKPDNIEALMKGPDLDGALIGGASLKVDSYVAIGRGAARARG